VTRGWAPPRLPYWPDPAGPSAGAAPRRHPYRPDPAGSLPPATPYPAISPFVSPRIGQIGRLPFLACARIAPTCWRKQADAVRGTPPAMPYCPDAAHRGLPAGPVDPRYRASRAPIGRFPPISRRHVAIRPPWAAIGPMLRLVHCARQALTRLVARPGSPPSLSIPPGAIPPGGWGRVTRRWRLPGRTAGTRIGQPSGQNPASSPGKGRSLAPWPKCGQRGGRPRP